MAYELKEGQGTLFKNEKQNDRQPDLKGTILIGGKTYEVAAWEKTSKRGDVFLSLRASLPKEKDENSSANTQPAPVAATFIDELLDQNGDNENLPF